MFTPFSQALPRSGSLNLNSRADMAFAASRMANPQLAEPPQHRNMLRTESEGMTRRRSKAQQTVCASFTTSESQETLRKMMDISDRLKPTNLSGSVSGWLDGLSSAGLW